MKKSHNGNESTIRKLRVENRELKETINVLSNTNVLKKINSALDDIKHGRYTVR